MLYLIVFLIGIAVIAGLIKFLFKKGVSLAMRIITILLLTGFSTETMAVPYIAYKNFSQKVDTKKVQEIIKDKTPGFSFYLNGEKIDPSKVDISDYRISVDTKKGTITLKDKEIPVVDAAEEFANTVGDFIFKEKKN